ncbi:O-antigen polymerase [Deinococcus sp. RL]|uniref:O-antigen polymerase n=1 Tax=Deinococcus sp. RL TaxID=1489678 RepID=UPI0013778973|nr:O-antigen polymerase [Deinococcus sp. RL]
MGFLLLIAAEGITKREEITGMVGWWAYDSASLFICLAFSLLCFSASAINLFDARAKSQNGLKNLRATNSTYVLLLVFYLVYFVYAIPLAITTFTSGRTEALLVETNRNSIQATLSGFGTLAGVILPAATTYLFFARQRFTGRYFSLKYISQAMLILSPLLVVQFFIGVRSVLLTTVISAFFVLFSIFRLRLSNAPSLVALAGLLLFITDFMKSTRLGGRASIENARLGSIDLSSFSEGVVQYLSKMQNYFPVVGFEQGKEHLTLLLFWVPRALWPQKPLQLENWFHQVIEPGRYPTFHSIAATFGATAYADFGFTLGILVCGLLGVLLGMIERKVNKYLHPVSISAMNPQIILYASTIGAIFYSTRQFNSVFITAFTLLLAFNLLKLTFRNENMPRNSTLPDKDSDHPATFRRG